MTDEIFTVNILTIFPELFPGPLGVSIIGKALDQAWKLNIINMRQFAINNRVDDSPYGGGPGMIIKPEVIGAGIEHIYETNPNTHSIYMSPTGKQFNQQIANDLITKKNITILCGRFEGVDYRAVEVYDMQVISVGDYILSGGELAAMAVVDSCVRLIPGVLGNPASTVEESFNTSDNLEYPHYTRPSEWKSKKVPDVLLSGNHMKIMGWRKEMSLQMIRKLRPDLIKE